MNFLVWIVTASFMMAADRQAAREENGTFFFLKKFYRKGFFNVQSLNKLTFISIIKFTIQAWYGDWVPKGSK